MTVKKAEVARVESGKVATTEQIGGGFVDLLRSATDAKAGPEVIELYAKLYREERDDRRRMDFDAAMSEAQGEMTSVKKRLKNEQTRSKYAAFTDLDEMIRPIYSSHGFAVSFDSADCPMPDCIRVLATVSHTGGWRKDYHIDMPADGKGAKGGDVMTKTHASGSAVKYGRRYLLEMIFNIATHDDDGNAAAKPIQTLKPAQVKVIEGLLKQLPPDTIGRMLKAYSVEAISAIPQAEFDKACRVLNKHINDILKAEQV